MAHVAAWKKDLVKELIDEMLAKPVVAVVNMHGIAGQQIQSMRAGLRAHATLKMPQQFQEFQPIGGVRAIFAPTFRVNSARASPFAFRAMSTSG